MNLPASNDTIWSLRGFVNESIALNDDASIDAGIKKLFNEYAASKNLPMAAVHIGRQLCDAGRPRAAELFQYVLDKYPDHEQALFAKVGMGHVYLLQGEDNQTEALYQKILTDYQNHPQLAEVVNAMAEGYYLRAFQGGGEQPSLEKGPTESMQVYLPKAIAKWELIAAQLPPHPQVTPTAYYQLGMAYYQLRDYERAEQGCVTLTAQWPENEYAWAAQLLVAKTYKDMIREGLLSGTDGEAKIQAACQQLLQKYPTCPAGGIAQRWLGQSDAMDKGGAR
jgi:tetratricopeptide (TPR) repeat protein